MPGGCFDQQPAFYSCHSAQRTGKELEEREREGRRDAERGGWKGGYCRRCLNALLLPAECQHLSLSPSLPRLPLHLTFLSVLQCVYDATRWRLIYREVDREWTL